MLVTQQLVKLWREAWTLFEQLALWRFMRGNGGEPGSIVESVSGLSH